MWSDGLSLSLQFGHSVSWNGFKESLEMIQSIMLRPNVMPNVKAFLRKIFISENMGCF